jgi:hypothetical protein
MSGRGLASKAASGVTATAYAVLAAVPLVAVAAVCATASATKTNAAGMEAVRRRASLSTIRLFTPLSLIGQPFQ